MKHYGYSLLLCLIALAGFDACTDFHFAIVANGSLPKNNGSTDTIRIRADSIHVQKLFPSNDTLFKASAAIAAHRTVRIKFPVAEQGQALDSLLLYGTLIADDSLDIALGHAGILDPLMPAEIDTAQGLVTHKISFRVQPGVDYSLEFINRHSRQYQVGGLLLVGYQTSDSSSRQIVPHIHSYIDYQILARDSATPMAPQMASWIEIQANAGDSVFLMGSPIDTLQFSICNASQMDVFQSQGVLPTSLQWQSGNGVDSTKIGFTAGTQWFYVVQNPDSISHNYADSLILYSRLTDTSN